MTPVGWSLPLPTLTSSDQIFTVSNHVSCQSFLLLYILDWLNGQSRFKSPYWEKQSLQSESGDQVDISNNPCGCFYVEGGLSSLQNKDALYIEKDWMAQGTIALQQDAGLHKSGWDYVVYMCCDRKLNSSRCVQRHGSENGPVTNPNTVFIITTTQHFSPALWSFLVPLCSFSFLIHSHCFHSVRLFPVVLLRGGEKEQTTNGRQC